MKHITLYILMIGLISISACKGQQKPSEPGQTFGEVITADDAMDFKTFIGQMASKDSLETKLVAKVESVCQVKGCWMNLVSTDESQDESVFVKFKDYGFFMPLDCAGKEVVVEGVAYREVTPVDELRHYAEDEGLSKEEIMKITEPKEELKFMAHGVIMK